MIWLISSSDSVPVAFTVIDCSMPVAVHNYLFAQRYGRSPSEIAGMVLISTGMSYVALPALLWFPKMLKLIHGFCIIS